MKTKIKEKQIVEKELTVKLNQRDLEKLCEIKRIERDPLSCNYVCIVENREAGMFFSDLLCTLTAQARKALEGETDEI